MTETSPTITASAGNNFLSSGSKTLTLYHVTLENISKSAGLIDLPMPTMDSNGKIVMDLMGASRTITVEGVVEESDVGTGNLYKYARDIAGLAESGYNTLINGMQSTTPYLYTPESLNRGSSGKTIKVVVSEASVKSERADPNSMGYHITMIEYGILV